MSKATVARAIRQRDRLLELLKRLDDRTLEDLDRRGRFTVVPDGYRPAAGGGVHGSDISRPVEGTVLAREAQPPADPLAKTILGIFAALGAADMALAGIDHALEVVRGYGSTAGRITSLAGDCGACGRPVAGTAQDPLRKGYCDACRKAYERDDEHGQAATQPDRAAFERKRRAKLANKPTGQAQAFACIHRCCTNTAIHAHFHDVPDCPNCAAITGETRANG